MTTGIMQQNVSTHFLRHFKLQQIKIPDIFLFCAETQTKGPQV